MDERKYMNFTLDLWANEPFNSTGTLHLRTSSLPLKRLEYYGLFIYNYVSSAHQGGIYLIKNTVQIVKDYNLKELFSIYVKCNLFLWSKLYFQHHYWSRQCHMIFRNHNNILLKKHFWLLSMLEAVVLLHIFVETTR